MSQNKFPWFLFSSADRVCAVVLFLFALGYVAIAARIEVAYFAGSVGPQHWAMGLGFVMMGFATALWFNPTRWKFANETLATWLAMVPLPISMLVYAFVLPQLGFVLVTVVFITLTARIYGGRWLWGIAIAVVMTLACYVLFDRVLGISLPVGEIWLRR